MEETEKQIKDNDITNKDYNDYVEHQDFYINQDEKSLLYLINRYFSRTIYISIFIVIAAVTIISLFFGTKQYYDLIHAEQRALVKQAHNTVSLPLLEYTNQIFINNEIKITELYDAFNKSFPATLQNTIFDNISASYKNFGLLSNEQSILTSLTEALERFTETEALVTTIDGAIIYNGLSEAKLSNNTSDTSSTNIKTISNVLPKDLAITLYQAVYDRRLNTVSYYDKENKQLEYYMVIRPDSGNIIFWFKVKHADVVAQTRFNLIKHLATSTKLFWLTIVLVSHEDNYMVKIGNGQVEHIKDFNISVDNVSLKSSLDKLDNLEPVMMEVNTTLTRSELRDEARKIFIDKISYPSYNLDIYAISLYKNDSALQNYLFGTHNVVAFAQFALLLLMISSIMYLTYFIVNKELIRRITDDLNVLEKTINNYSQVNNLEYSANVREFEQLIKKVELLKLNVHDNEEKLKRISETDHMTGIANRRGLSWYLKQLTVRMDQMAPVVFVMFDIDFFKKVNDTYGHEAGDQVIIRLTQIVSSMTRQMQDIVARTGGEEFTLVLTKVGLERATAIAENIRKKIEQETVETHGHSIKFTISMGLCQHEDVNSYEHTIELADKALYHAKKTGRNKVVVYSPDLATE